MTSSRIEQTSPETQELYKIALLARSHAYVPYSGYQVGSAIRLSNGKVYSGCNVENSSYSATICAERVAIHKAISDTGRISITEVMVVTQATPPWPPCGVCRQVISEFGAHATIYTANVEGDVQTSSFSEIFPRAFTPDYLSK